MLSSSVVAGQNSYVHTYLWLKVYTGRIYADVESMDANAVMYDDLSSTFLFFVALLA